MSGNTQKDQAAAAAASPTQGTKVVLFAVLVTAAFMLSYTYASARSTDPTGDTGPGLFGAAAGGGGCGGGCCGGGGPAVEGATVVEGDVQRIAVDTSAGSFNPNVIKATAGVPIVIEFSQAPGGCLSGVWFPDFNINEDLTRSGKTIELPPLDPGEYSFYCQMQMVSAKIVVE